MIAGYFRTNKVRVQLQRSCVLQPRVAAAATLGKGWGDYPTATRLRRFLIYLKMTQPRCGWMTFFIRDPRVAARRVNPGLKGATA